MEENNSQHSPDEFDKALRYAFSFPWEKGEKPYFTNPEGVEWYIDKETTQWAQREDQHGTKLPNIVGFFTKKNDSIERVLMDKEINEVIYASTNLEAVAYRIDMLKALERYE